MRQSSHDLPCQLCHQQPPKPTTSGAPGKSSVTLQGTIGEHEPVESLDECLRLPVATQLYPMKATRIVRDQQDDAQHV